MQDIKNKIEAVLFITGRFLNIEDIAKFCNVASIGSIKQAMKGLQADYSKRAGALEIITQENKYKLNIKKNYIHLSRKLVSACELDQATQATLAIIAYKQPAMQSEIVKIRGSSAYEHIKTLREEEFITSEKKGRTRVLKLAPKFYDYFDVVQEQLAEKFGSVAEKQQQLLEEDQKPKEEVTEVEVAPIAAEEIEEIVEEKTKPARSVVVEVRKMEEMEDKKQEVEEELDTTPKEVLMNLDADDFGS